MRLAAEHSRLHLASRVLLACSSVALACGIQLAEPVPPSVLLITVDTLRSDHLGCYGYFRETSPEIDRLARESMVFEHIVTPMPTTLPAHLSLMTSMLPAAHGVDRNGLRFESGPGRKTLAQVLKARGYTTAAVVSAHPLYRDSGIAVGFDDFKQPDPEVDAPDELRFARHSELVHSARASATTRTSLRWLEAVDRSEPFLLWIHYFDPHNPYMPPAPFNTMFESSRALTDFLEERGVLSPSAERPDPGLAHREPGVFGPVSPAEVNNRYDGEIRYVDNQIGILLARLRELELYDETTIVLTGDHGEGLFQHHWVGHGRTSNEQLFVPLVIKPSESLDRPPGRFSRLGSLIDVVPTLLELMGIELTEEEEQQYQGTSLLGAPPSRAFAVIQQSPTPQGAEKALLTARWKLRVLSDGRSKLFDLETDRFELRNVEHRHPEIASRMRQALEIAIRARPGRGEEAESRDEESLEALRSLGYIE